MKITFKEPNNYLEVYKTSDGKIYLTLSSPDTKNKFNYLINSVELTTVQFLQIVQEIAPTE
jgi:hypothetical protein